MNELRCDVCGEPLIECACRDDYPAEGDLVTSDHRHFYEFGHHRRPPVVVVAEGESMAGVVMLWMVSTGFFPDVWFVSDHGNFHRIDLVGDDPEGDE